MGDAGDNAKGQAADARRFAAFISYSHADADAAAKLQRKLERYRLPKRIAEARLNATSSLGAIFRDREDLAAAASLSAAIRDAIARAEALIVLCSPDAAASPWVAAEIELFRELHPSKPVLAALVTGEPAKSFPAALTTNGNEPLAADLRPEGDGEQLGFLKIVAGIAGVPLDALIQRDAQRRIRRVTAITAGALAAMLIMGIMTTLALQARNEAARQRASAEGLVEYMLTDLREKLKGVGRLDVQAAVNRKMMKHYQAQGRIETLAEDSLERRARVLHAMGEDFEMSGELDDASSVFNQAKDATETLLARKPDDPERIFTHAQSEYWVGYAALLKNDFQTAEEQAAKYQRLAEKLLRVHPDQVVAKKEVGWAANFLGVVKLYGRDNPAGALKQLLKYRTIFADLVKTHPKDTEALHSLSMAHALIAEAYLTMGNENKSLHHRKLEQGIVDQLYDNDPENAQIWMLNIIRNRDIARILIRKKDFRNAERYLVQAEDWSAKLVRLDRRNAAWRLQDALNLIVRVTLDRYTKAPNAKRNFTRLTELISDQVFLNTLRDQDRTYLKSRAAEALRQI